MKITLNARPTYSGEPKGIMTLPFSLQSCGPNGSAADLARSFSSLPESLHAAADVLDALGHRSMPIMPRWSDAPIESQ